MEGFLIHEKYTEYLRVVGQKIFEKILAAAFCEFVGMEFCGKLDPRDAAMAKSIVAEAKFFNQNRAKNHAERQAKYRERIKNAKRSSSVQSVTKSDGEVTPSDTVVSRVTLDMNEMNDMNEVNEYTHNVTSSSHPTLEDVKRVAHDWGADDQFACQFFSDMQKLGWTKENSNGRVVPVNLGNLSTTVKNWWHQEKKNRSAAKTPAAEDQEPDHDWDGDVH